MKKILLLMTIMVVIIVGLVNVNYSYEFEVFKSDDNKIVSNSLDGKPRVVSFDNIGDVGQSPVSIYSSNYGDLQKFICDYNLKPVDSYYCEKSLVTMYYSPWFGADCDGTNFQLVDYGDSYILGYPYIFEGF